MSGSSGAGLSNIFSHRFNFHYPRRKSVDNPLNLTPSPSPIDDTVTENRQWRESTPDLNRFIIKSGKIQRVGAEDQEADGNMDSALRARNMRSASSRRRKILEREDSLRREDEAREKRRREIIFGYASDEEQDSDSDDGHTYSPIEDKAVDEAEKPSHDINYDSNSLRTHEVSRIPSLRRLSAHIPPLKINTKGITIVAGNLRSQSPSPPPKPDTANVRVLEQELFNCLYPNQTSVVDNEESDVEFEAGELEQYTPIEIATPVVFRLPKRKPTLVSIETPASSISSEPPSIPKPQRKAPRRPPSIISVRSGFAACEATPFEIPPLPTPPYNANGFDFNLPPTEASDPHPLRQSQTEPVTSTTIQKCTSSSLLSRSKSWRENHRFRRQHHQPREETETSPRTSSATNPIALPESTPLSPSSPMSDDYEFEIPAGFPLPPTNIPTPQSFLTEDSSLQLGFKFHSSQPRPEILLPRTYSPAEPRPLPSPPISFSTRSNSSRTNTPSPHPSSSTNASSNASPTNGITGLLTRKKSLNGLRSRSGTVGKAIASRGAKLGRSVTESVKKVNAPPLPPLVPGSTVRDFAA